MKLSIIIPTKDRPQLILQTLTAVYKATTHVNCDIIVINDSVNTLELPNNLANVVQVFQNPKSGVASARNFGAKQATGELLLFLDDDMLINPEDIQTTLRLHEQYQRCCINLNWIYPPEQTHHIQKRPFGRYLIHYGFTSLKGWNRDNYWNDNELFVTNGITSQYLSITKEDFDASGGYNEAFPHAGFEDYEFGKRLQQQGITFYIYPLSRIFHNEADRLDIEPWLNRRQRGGQTRKVAVSLGYEELKINYSFTKLILLKTLSWLKPLLKLSIKYCPNIKIFDFLYFRIINILLAVSIYEGYTN